MTIFPLKRLKIRSAALRYRHSCLAVLLVPLLCLPATGQIRINEIVASNRGTLNDSDGDSSDWIEIFNSGGALAPGGGNAYMAGSDSGDSDTGAVGVVATDGASVVISLPGYENLVSESTTVVAASEL